jgi:signal transduction histidine kinase/ActR/RegA family two-component response regulator
VHPRDVVGVHATLKETFDRGGRRALEFKMLDVSGHWHQLEASLQLLDAETPPVVALTASDVTELRQLTAALRERDDQLRQARKMEVVGRLATGVAHDFGNLLTIIIGASGQLADGLAGDSPLRTHAQSIQLSAERAASLVRQLLGFGRQRAEEPTVLEVNDVVAEAEQLLVRLLGEHIALKTSHAADLWRVKADRTQLEQVLLNLAANARDAMPNGGTLTIETRNAVADDAINASVGASGPFVVISVTDTGVGMDAATQAQAFEPFFTTKSFGKGTGLGLATVQQVVKEAGGWTRLTSAPGKGTTVAIGLPRETEPVSPAPAVAAAAGGGETLLLVEDEEGVRELVRDILSMAGYAVLEAAMPSEAERISREHTQPIQLLLTDVVMPEMSGLELSMRLRASRPGLQVMYMSGFPEPLVGDGVTEAPGAHFISKPFNRQSLLERVRRALDTAEKPVPS